MLAMVVLGALALGSPSELDVSPQTSFTTGGTVVYVRSPYVIGCYGTCDAPKVLFGGVESPDVHVLDPYRVTAVAPPHASEEIVSVSVVTPDATYRVDGEFAYERDRMPVLVPIAATGWEGQSGTRWTSELWAYNDSDEEVSLQAHIRAGMLGLFLCGRDPLLVAPKSSRRLPAGVIYAIGEYLYVPRDVADRISFDLRVSESAHGGHDVSIPVLRDPPRVNRLTFLNVPGDAQMRKFLRVYVRGDASVHVYVYDIESDTLLGAQLLELTLPTDGSGPPAGALSLATAQIFNVADVQRASRLRVDVVADQPSSMVWGMITATDNATQHVTVITPQ